jgi:hypothetical protein
MMVIKYRTTRNYVKIESFEVIKETEKTVTFLACTRDGAFREERQLRTADWHQWHNSWEDAHTFLIKRAGDNVEGLRRQLERANGELGNIKGMKNPTAEVAP